MTLENCKRLLEQAKKAGDKKAIAFWSERVARKQLNPKYAEAHEKDDGKKPKR